MRKLIGVLIILVSALSIKAQTYVMSELDGQTIQACSGSFTLGNYSLGETFSLTICSDEMTDLSIGLFINNGYSFPMGTSLCVYDGASSMAPLLVCFNNATVAGTLAVQATNNNPSGCLTFVFTGGAIGASWDGELYCSFICQQRQVEIISAIPLIQSDGFINVCWDDSEDQSMPVEFTAQGTYSASPYPCDDVTNVFTWSFDDGTPIISGLGLTTVTHSFTGRQGYNVFVSIEDSEGCEAVVTEAQRVRVSMAPEYILSETSISPTTICPGQPVEACVGYNEPDFSNACIIPHGSQIPIPDNPPLCVSSSIHINCFEPGSTLTSTNQLLAIQMKLAHTYIGDLTFYIQCANGQQVQMGQQGGGGCNLGNPPSVGYWYNITPTATQTMQVAANSQTTLPAGNYASYQSLAGLIGCPLNGMWTIRICDNWSADSGTLFDWTIDFSDNLSPDLWEYTQTYNSITWLGSYGSQFYGPNNEECATMTYLNPIPADEESVQPVIVSLSDNFGCLHDTTMFITVRTADASQCCPQFTTSAGQNGEICGLEYELSATLHTNFTGQWALASGPGEAVFSDSNNPYTSVSVFPFGTYYFVWTEMYLGYETCFERDTVEIVFNPSANPFIGEIENVCAGSLPFQIDIESVGELTCVPNNDFFNLSTGSFNPEIPGQYTITNTVLDQCSGQEAVYSTSFTVLNTAQVINFQEICVSNDPDPALVEISFDVTDSENNPFSDYFVNGLACETPSSSFDTIMPSPANYSFTVTDINGCNSIILAGNRDCSCPLFAGTFEDIEFQNLCETECTGTTIIHNNDQNSDGGAAIFEFILKTEDNQILEYSANSDFCFDSENMYYDTVYYISAVCGYPDAENHADLTSICYSISQSVPVTWMKNPLVWVGNNNDTCGNIIRIVSNIPEEDCYGYWTSECDINALSGYNLFSNNTWIETVAPAECYIVRTVTNGVCSSSDSVLIEFNLMPTPNAGEDMFVCGLDAQLNGTASIEGSSIMWITGGLPLSSIYDLNATVHSDYYISREIKLRESYMGCTAFDEMMITFIDDLNIWSSPGTDNICGTNSQAVVYGQVYNGHWEAYYHGTTTPPSFAYELLDNTNDTVVFSFDDFPEGEHNIDIDLIWYGLNPTGGGVCTTTATKNFIFSQTPIANAGSDTIISNCGNCVSLIADTTDYSWANFHWVSFLNGQFTDPPTNPLTVYCIDPDYLYGGNSIQNEFLLTANNMGCISVDTLKVVFYSNPEIISCPNDTIVYNSTPILLSNTSTVYQVEYFGDSVINNIFYPGNFDGNFEILYVLTDSLGCQNSCTFIIEVLLNSLQINASEISIFPNPNDGKFIINLENANDVRKIEILNSAGAVVHAEYYNENIGESIEVEAALVPGLYILRLIGSDKTFVGKMVVEY